MPDPDPDPGLGRGFLFPGNGGFDIGVLTLYESN